MVSIIVLAASSCSKLILSSEYNSYSFPSFLFSSLIILFISLSLVVRAKSDSSLNILLYSSADFSHSFCLRSSVCAVSFICSIAFFWSISFIFAVSHSSTFTLLTPSVIHSCACFCACSVAVRVILFSSFSICSSARSISFELSLLNTGVYGSVFFLCSLSYSLVFCPERTYHIAIHI